MSFPRFFLVAGFKGIGKEWESESADPINRKLSANNAKVLRPTLFNYIYTREETVRYADELWRMMIDDKFTVRIHEVYPLKDVARAHNVSYCSKDLFDVMLLM